MFATITNLITKKTFLGLLLCVIIFMVPISLSYTGSNDPAVQKMGGHVLVAFAADKPWFEIGSIGDAVWGVLGAAIMAIPSAFLWIGGMLLDTSLEKLVFGMGNYLGNNSSGKSLGAEINNAWILIRDICNLAFIFGFVYVGIRTIIDPESASTKRFLSKIIIGALLINFSLFFVKFIVDFANFTAYQIYTAMVGGQGSLSATVADRLGIITFFSSPGAPNAFANLTGPGTFWYFILAAVFLFVVAFIFTAAALLLITRFVGIVLIMVGSPILFAATVFPQTEHYASDMWKKLISYAFFAPAFLLLLLVSLTLINGFGIVPNGTNSFINALTNTDLKTGDGRTGFLGVVLNFVIVIFFFIQSLLIAQKMGVAGGDAAVSMGNKIRGNVQSALGRNSIGWVGDKASKGIQNLRENPNSRTARYTGGFLHATVGGVADSAKGAKFGGSMSRTDAKKDNESLDTARAKNAQVTTIDGHLNTAVNAPNDSQAQIAMERSVAGASTEQLQSLLKKHKKNPNVYNAIVKNMSNSQMENMMKLKPEDMDDKEKADLQSKRASVIQEKHGVNQQGAATQAGNIGKAGGTDLDAMNFNVVMQHAGQLNMKQIDDMKGLTDTAKKNLKDERERQLVAEFTAAGGSAALFGRITKETERAQLPKAILLHSHAGEYITRPTLNKILDGGEMTSAERDVIKNNTLNAWNPGSPEFAALNDYFTNSPTGKLF